LQALDVTLVAAAENFGQEFINHGFRTFLAVSYQPSAFSILFLLTADS
jgi:hypothetical protein